MRPNLPFAIAAASISLLAMAAAWWLFDPEAILKSLTGFPVWTLASIILILTLSALLAGLRLRSISHHLGHRLSVAEAMQAMAAGQVVGSLSIQFFGQIAARTALLRSRGVDLPANILLSSYERLVAFSVSSAMAVTGAVLLFGGVAVQLESGGFEFLWLSIGTLCAVTGGALVGWGRSAFSRISDLISWGDLAPILRSFGYTVGIQAGTACAYVVAAKSIVPAVDLLSLFAASFVVMFAASLPISFSGWGIRELSAVLALKAVGVPAASAVAVAIVVGLTSLAVVVIIALLSSAFRHFGRQHIIDSRPTKPSPDFLRALGGALPLLVATLIVIQVKAPTASGLLNLNPADPLVILGAALFISYAHKHGWPPWQMPHLVAFIALMTAAIALSFLNGWISFGLTSWALYNRFLGWFVLICFGLTGALLTLVAGAQGTRLMLRTFVGAVAGVVALNWAALALSRAGLAIPIQFLDLPFKGLSGNRNAFSFLIIMAICCLPMMRFHPVALSILALGVWFTGSLAAAGTAVLILVIAAVRRTAPTRRVLLGLALCAVTIVATNHQFAFQDGSVAAPTPFVLSDSSLLERWQSIQGGFRLFLAHPIFGAGLGAFMDSQIRSTGALVIHSSPVWIMAEMGGVGLLIFALFGWRLSTTALTRRDEFTDTLFLLLIAFCSMAAVHDMMYQRSIWLLGGALLLRSYAGGTAERPPDGGA